MRSSAVILPLLATLAVATPISKREAQNQSSASMKAFVCSYFPDSNFCKDSSSTGVTAETTTGTSGSSSSSGGSASGSSSGSTSGSNTSGSTSGSTTSTGTSSDSDNWAALHNAKRALHQDTGNLTYDDTLAAGALDHSKKCVFEHSESNGDYGENLAMGSGLTNDQTVDMWYDEIKDYGSYWGKDDVPMGVMHFTQVVWKGTTKVGCGVYDCGSQGNLVTCRYQAAGNYLGEFAANVGELKSS